MKRSERGQVEGSAGVRSHTLEETLRSNLPLVNSTARRLACWKPPHVDLEDLQAWGMVGLLDAYRRYQPSLRVPFARYARVRIRGAIIDSMRRQDRLTRTARRRAALLQHVQDALTATLKRPPTEHELASAMEVDVATLRRAVARALAGREIHLDETQLDRSEHASAEYLAEHDADPQRAVLAGERSRILAAALVGLTERQRAVIALYYGQDLRMKEVARELGVSEARVSQIRTRALAYLRLHLSADLAHD